VAVVIIRPSHFRLNDFIIITTIFSSGLSSNTKAKMESKEWNISPLCFLPLLSNLPHLKP
jgi:hypothetical protein